MQLHDSYGLLVNCSLAGDFDAQDLTWLKALQRFIAQAVNNLAGTLGQTWIFSAYVENLPNDDAFIKNCCQILFSGKLFKTIRWNDKIIYEISDPHTIVIFYTNQQALKQENAYFTDWLYLLFYRHKISWAYQQSRQLVKQLKKTLNTFERMRAT